MLEFQPTTWLHWCISSGSLHFITPKLFRLWCAWIKCKPTADHVSLIKVWVWGSGVLLLSVTDEVDLVKLWQCCSVLLRLEMKPLRSCLRAKLDTAFSSSRMEPLSSLREGKTCSTSRGTSTGYAVRRLGVGAVCGAAPRKLVVGGSGWLLRG